MILSEFLEKVDYQFTHRANIGSLKGSSGIREVIEAIKQKQIKQVNTYMLSSKLDKIEKDVEEKNVYIQRPTIVTPEFIAEEIWNRKDPPNT